MTFKDLKQRLAKLNSSNSDNVNNNNQLEILKGKEFWIWDREQHIKDYNNSNGNCCFNHIISLPTKNGVEMPIFDYQKLIFDAIENNQNVWIKKSRGIGVTTFLIRYLAW